MNNTYRLVYSKVHKAWVAVAEHVRACGKKGAARLLTNIALVATSAAAAPWAMAAPPPAVNQLPTGAQIAAGSITIHQTQTAVAASMAVQQSSNQAIVNWQSFNVGAHASVTISQPSSSSVLLSRVLDSNPSQIFGQIKANGQVFLTNPSGVYFAPGSSVDVGSFTATTHGISDSDFLGANFHFSRNGATGSITNEGSISAALGGYIALLAPEVRNQGVVLAQMGGTVALAAGESYQLQINNNQQLSNVLVTPSTINTLVDNGNAVQAPGGLVILSAQAASSLLGGVVKNSGHISATGLFSDGGVIRLGASNTITLAPTSSITSDAAPASAGSGGRIEVIADLANPASSTQVDGTLSAKGGQQGGDGGFVETSASQLKIADTARASTLAAQGQAGTWLLDPKDFTIAASGGDITGTTLSSNLGSGNVTITSTNGANGTVGDVNVNANVNWSANVLTLTASNNVNVNANLSGSGTADLTINGNGLSGNGNMSVGSARTLTVNQSGSTAYSGVISGAGNLVLTGTTGTLNLSGNNSYGGYTWIKSGTLQLGNGTTLGNTSAIRLSDKGGSGRGAWVTTGTLDLNGQSVTNTALPLVLLADSGSNLILNSSTNKAIFAGTLNPYSGAPTFVMTGGDIEMSGAMGGFAVGGYAAGGYQGMYLQGPHTLTLSGTTPRSWNGNNAIDYWIHANSGSPTLKITGAFGPDISRIETAMTFDYESASNLNITSDIVGAAAVVNIIKGGAGTLTLTGRNYSSGTITVNAGTLAMTNSTMPNLSSMTVNSASTLDLQNVSLSKPLTLSGGSLTASTGSSTLSGPVTLGASSGVGGAGGLTLSGAITSNGYGLALVGAGAKTLNNSSNTLSTIATGTGVGAVTVTNNTALTVGQVTEGGATYAGINSTGGVSILTNNGNLTVAQPVTTTSTSANALTLRSSSSYAVLNVTPIYLLPASGLTGEYGIAPVLNYWYSSSASSVVPVAYTGIPSTIQSFSLASGAVTNTINVSGGVTGALALSGSPSIATGGLVATTNAGTYGLTLSPNLTLAGYAFYAGNAVNYTISPKAVAVTNVSRSTTYDGISTYASLANATSFLTSGLVGLDSVASVTQTASLIGVAKASSFNVMPSAAVMGRGLASNYAFRYIAATTTVAKADLNVTGLTASDKTYDATTTASLSGTASVAALGNDVLILGGTATGTFADKNAGAGKTITVTGNTLSGPDAANYNLVQQSGLSATITPASLSVRANDDARFVTLTDSVGYNGVAYSGFVGGESAASSDLGGTLLINRTNRVSDLAAATYAGVLHASGLTSGNYALSYLPGDYTIVPAQQLLVKLANNSTVYGSTAVYSISSAQYLNGANVLSDLTLVSANGATSTYSDASGGSATFTLAPKNAVNSSSGHVQVGVYQLGASSSSITGANFNALNFVGAQTVTPKTLNMTYAGVSKTYDATRTASVSATDDRIAGDVFNVALSASFADKNVGAGKTINVSSVSATGADAPNYSVSAMGVASATITPASLTVSGLTAANKTYDATINASLGGTANITALAGDTVTLEGAAVGTFADKNAGTAKTVTVTGITISGADAANYNLVQQSGLSANIAKADLTIRANNESKRYDAVAYSTGNGVRYSGFVDGENPLSLSGSLGYAGTSQGARDAGTYLITPNGLTSSNYALQFVDGSLTISPAALTLTAPTNTKSFDGTSSAQALPTASGLMGLDRVTNLVASYADANPGNGKTLRVQDGFVISDGNGGANYVVTLVPDVSGVIRALPVAVLPPPNPITARPGNAAPISTPPPSATNTGSSAGVTVSTIKLSTTQAFGLVAVVVPAGTSAAGTGLVIALPDAVFAAIADAATTARITLLNQQPLPSWIRYDTDSKTLITAAVPTSAFPLAILVTVGNQSTVVQISESQTRL